MAEKLCIHYVVSGRVQGVFFRASTLEKAQELGLTGWVRNLPEGQVEVLACGPKAALVELQQWLQRGPRFSKVSQVRHEEVTWQEHIDFKVI